MQALPGAGAELGGGLTEAMVRFAARHEYARTVEDVLARRSRLLFLDAAAGRPGWRQLVARLLREETGAIRGRRPSANWRPATCRSASRREGRCRPAAFDNARG